MLCQNAQVARPAVPVSDTVEVDREVAEPERLEKAPRQQYDFGVHGGAAIANDLTIELMELSIATGLGPVVPKHAPQEVHFHRLRTACQAVLQVSPHNRGRRLGAQG